MSDSTQIGSYNLSSTLLNIQSLESEFKNVLKQYEQAHLDYLNIKNDDYELTNNSFYWSSSSVTGIGQPMIDIHSIDACKAICSSDINCSGATHFSMENICAVVSGPGSVQPSPFDRTNDTAMVKINGSIEDKTKQREMINKKIDDLNTKLMIINQKISKELDNAIPDIQAELSLKNVDKNHLQTIYNKLLDDRTLIKQRIGEYNQVSSEYDDTKLYVNMENSQYVLWFIVALLALLYTIKFMFFPESITIKYAFWLFLILLFIITTMRINSAPGFILWGLLITLILFMQIKIIPSP